MKTFRWLAVASSVVSLFVGAACGDDEAIVRGRLDGGLDGNTAVNDGGLSCGATPPSTYESPTFETNAAQELGLRNAFDHVLAPMKNVEAQLDGGSPTPITKAQLDALYSAGTPSVKATTTSYFQEKVEAWLTSYEVAVAAGVYTPDVPAAGAKGGA